MSKMVIYKNRGEEFNCNLKVDGADHAETSVRLCLEFEDNKNMFFYGVLQKNGECKITVPKMPEMPNKSGKLTVEAIADSVYFKLLESEVELRNSVEIDFKPEMVKETTIELQHISKVNHKESKSEPKTEPKTEPEVIQEEKQPEKPKFEPIRRKKFTFQDYVEKRHDS